MCVLLTEQISQAVSMYGEYIKLYTYSLDDSDQLAYLKKRPLSRLTYLGKTLSNIETHHTQSIGAGLIQELVVNCQGKFVDEMEQADMNTFIFSKVCDFDTLQPVSAVFNPSQIILRDCFEMDLYHPKEGGNKIQVEILLLLHREKTDLAICSLEFPGRALMFPSFRQGDVFYDEKVQSANQIVLTCCQCSYQKKIVLHSNDQTKIKSWRWKFSQLFAGDSYGKCSTSSSTSSIGSIASGLGITFGTPQKLIDTSFLTPPSAAYKRLTLPLTPSLVDQLKEFLDPDFDSNDSNDTITIEPKPTPAKVLPSASPDEREQRLRRAQLARKEIEKEMFQKEQKLIQFRRESESGMVNTQQQLLTPKTTPPKNVVRKPIGKVVNDNLAPPTPVPSHIPLPNPSGEKRRLVLSPSDEASTISNEKRPLLSTSRESSPGEEEKEAVRTRNMLQSRGSPRVKNVTPRNVTSMYVLRKEVDDEEDKENINPNAIPRSNSDTNTSAGAFRHNVSSPYVSPIPNKDDDEFHLRAPGTPVSTPPSKFRFVRKVSGSLKKMMKKSKQSKMQFDILNLTPPVDDGEFKDDSVVDATSDTTYPSPKVATAVYESSNNSTVEKGSLSSISMRSLPRSNQSSSDSIQIDKIPDCSVQEFWNRKKAENSSITLFQGLSLILSWQDGSWVSLTDNKECIVQVNVNGEGAVILAKLVGADTSMKLNLLPTHEIRRSTMHDIQIKSPNRTTMFRIMDIEQADKFWAAIRKDFKNQPLFDPHGPNGVQSQPPSLNDKDSSLGSLSSALANNAAIQYQQYTLVPPMISTKSATPSPVSEVFPSTPPPSATPPVDNTELLLLNNLRCKLIQKEDDGWQEEGQLARLSVFSVPTSTSKSILIRGPSNLSEPLIYEKNMKGTSFERIGKVGISIRLVGQTEIEISNLLQFKGEKEAAYVYELLTDE